MAVVKNKPQRVLPQGEFPLVDLAGPVAEVGRSLGFVWRDALQLSARRSDEAIKPWWTRPPYRKLVSRYAPYLPSLYEAMAQGASVPLWAVAADTGMDDLSPQDGCTSFAIQPRLTLDGAPISGQTKDTALERAYQYQVLRLRMTDAPQHLTLTYPGWLYGHGFIQGGCALFRNSLYNPPPGKGMAYPLFGLLALHCPSVEDVARMTRDHGIRQVFHVAVADEQGHVLGLENTAKGVAVLKPRDGLYVHANCILGSKAACKVETDSPHFSRKDSLYRTSRLQELLQPKLGRITAQEAMYALADRQGQPRGLSRVEPAEMITSACIVAEPTRGMLHVTRGSPAENWPQTYRL